MADDVTTVPIGHDQDFVYRLLADPDGLVPHNRHMGHFTPAEEPLLPCYILGVNTTVQPCEPALPASRRKANLSEVSTHSAESDDNEAPGFIFFTLGPLEYSRHRLVGGSSSVVDENGLEWKRTGFCLIARVGDFGHISGVYATYDMFLLGATDITHVWFPTKEDVSGGPSRDQITSENWGIPPGGGEGGGINEQFSLARIGDTVGSLGFARPIMWHDEVEHPVELVRVKRTGNSLGVLRQNIGWEVRHRWVTYLGLGLGG
ncbi:hypothetical protein B0T25DRAFT_583207 [Lasiosphaeria hispida]|uniref:Uncharacterized protein n=1 Tax=Lasiosphaeria hispida TaxID=260671 RepID=A0AAJ0MA88_9PEZI|nr:hypothetical protein B0T25DRAFT_583207 [Lasiosphaeria hispida]